MIAEPAADGEVAEIVRACEADRIETAPIGAARTMSQIRRAPLALGISLARMARIVAYEPADMTLAVQAGASVGEVNRATDSARQHLPVDPPNPDATTIGSLIAASHSGPLRLSEGTARDLLIGIRYVGREGRIVKGGGRVVKNVAGYDLMKVMGGSFGTLGIIVEATFKVLPIPEHRAAAFAGFRGAGDAFDAARRLNDALPLSYLEVLSPAAARMCGRDAAFVAVAGFSGSRGDLDEQWNSIRRLAPAAQLLEASDADALYARIRDLDFSAAPIAALVAMPPAELAAALMESGAEFAAHAGCGVAKVFLAGAHDETGVAQAISRWRRRARVARGNLRIIRRDPSMRPWLESFDTPDDGALRLMKRLKAAFDPAGIFNPGCFVGGI